MVVGGLSAVGAALVSIGIPKDSVVEYETALRTDQYLLVMRGNASEVAKAKDIIGTTRAVSSTVHFGRNGWKRCEIVKSGEIWRRVAWMSGASAHRSSGT
jgi:hypothetical protein